MTICSVCGTYVPDISNTPHKCRYYAKQLQPLNTGIEVSVPSRPPDYGPLLERILDKLVSLETQVKELRDKWQAYFP